MIRPSHTGSHELQEELVGGIDDAPRQDGAVIVQVCPPVEVRQFAVPLAPDGAQDLYRGVEIASHLRLHAGLQDIEREEEDAKHGSQQAAADEVVDQVGAVGLGLGEAPLDGPAEAEEQSVAGPVPQQDGPHAAVALAYAMVPHQRLERVDGVSEAAVVPLVLQQRLNPLEGGQGRLGDARQHGRHAVGQQPRGARGPRQQSRHVLVQAKHDGHRGGLLKQRGQQAAVQVAHAVPLQLADGLARAHAEQLLPEQHFLDGEGDHDVGEGGAGAAGVVLNAARRLALATPSPSL